MASFELPAFFLSDLMLSVYIVFNFMYIKADWDAAKEREIKLNETFDGYNSFSV